ncbi:MAG: T9SS type A sorting domain-containing protein [Bacteroidetes bacterium]|nr:T9SS type A sorting domain-containing protein [Bacteroidota bacterium]
MRIILLIAILGISNLAVAQRQTNLSASRNKTLSANSDTLLYINLPGLSINPNDSASFNFYIEDGDGYPSIIPSIIPQYTQSDFSIMYSLDSSKNSSGEPTKNNFYHPWELQSGNSNDTSFFFFASTVSDTLGEANDWIMFGPITIPINGGSLTWYDKTWENRNGYQVVVVDNNPYPFGWPDYANGTQIFSETDSPMPSLTYSSDTTWEYKSVSLNNYSGQSIHIGFNHNSTNMNFLFLDEISIIKNNINCDANFTMLQDSINSYSYTIYNNSSSGTNYSYFWEFGDGSTSNLEFPTHTYAGVGPYQLCLTVVDTSGCSDVFCDSLYAGRNETGISITVVPNIVTSINNYSANDNITLYPNPALDQISITSQDISTIQKISVYDLTGRLVKDVNNIHSKETAINISDLESGIYFLTVNDGKRSQTQKFIKQ